ncbi:hypothetical protein AAF712_006459 [Marasmius tenuissimus]|uniref:Uncharacterized protein n=1 Tax=Marasmius tenuissimus TaxID=585030 RepID=A0ABR3A1I4_9AGAR
MPWVDTEERTPELDALVEKVVRSRWWADSAVVKPFVRWKHVCISRHTLGGTILDNLPDDDDGDLLSPEAVARMNVIAAEGLSLDFESEEVL